MQQITPETFTKLMLLPLRQRDDLLEFIGSTPVSDKEVLHLVNRMAAGELNDSNRAA